MEEQSNAGATTKADNLEKPTANNTASLETDRTAPSYPNKANDSKGAGSPYGGTQSADGKAPDGNQQINTGASGASGGNAVLPEALGDEYGTQSSYGNKGDDKEGDDNGGTDARGSAIS